LDIFYPNNAEGEMIKRLFIVMGLVAAFLVSISCVGPSRLERHFSTSFELAKSNQIFDPEAERNMEPVTGLDGEAARTTIEKYRKEFEKPAAPTPYILELGSLGR
jgi:hypothetical protein